jgi:AcrR family transcriptional regulator
MVDKQADRRVQRSKQLLYSALMSLVGEKSFDKITVQDILERANVGRTTFYAHFQSKEDLFLSSHDHIVNAISCSFFSEEGTLRTEPSPDLIAFLALSQQSRDMYFYLTGGSDRGEILRLLKERIAQQLAAQLDELFNEDDSVIPFSVLAQHVASSIVSVSSWWMEKRTPYTVQEIAAMLHQMNYVALRYGLEK